MSKENQLPAMCAYEIDWDTDVGIVNVPAFVTVPTMIFQDNEQVSDYISDQTGYCHNGFRKGMLFRGIPVHCTFVTSGEEYVFYFIVDAEDSYTVSIMRSRSTLVFVDNEFGHIKLQEMQDADRYLTVQELLTIMEMCSEMIWYGGAPLNSCEINKMLTVSTQHISAETADILDKEVAHVVTKWKQLPPIFSKGDYGWFIYCGESENCKCPNDLKAVIDFAVECGCTWLCLDADGNFMKNLDVYSWGL